VEFHIERLWSYNITLTRRLVNTVTTQMPLRIVQSGRLDAKKLVSHRLELSVRHLWERRKGTRVEGGAQERERKRRSLEGNL
jgi:threonine dehydrogenase-like Zn-dependent dehydrogenase